MFLVIGVLIVTGCVAGGYMLEGGNLKVLFQPTEVLIIGGAALGQLLIATPLSIVKGMVGQFKWFFSGGNSKDDYLELLGLQYQLFKLVQQSGVMSLESHFEDPEKSPVLSKYPSFLHRHHALDFLSDSVKVIIIGGISPHDLESLMDEDLRVQHEAELKPSATLNKIGDAHARTRHRRRGPRRRHHDGRHRRSALGDRPQGCGGTRRHVPRHPDVLRLRARWRRSSNTGSTMRPLRAVPEDGIARGLQGIPAGDRRGVRASCAAARGAPDVRRDREVLQERGQGA